jgi:hypothetical protein
MKIGEEIFLNIGDRENVLEVQVRAIVYMVNPQENKIGVVAHSEKMFLHLEEKLQPGFCRLTLSKRNYEYFKSIA